MKILITGTSKGIGKAIAQKFLAMGHRVIGFDKERPGIQDKFYTHFVVNICNKATYPYLPEPVDILINNAGIQTENIDNLVDIRTNLISTIDITEKYGIQPNIKSILFIGSASGHTGSEFPKYAASKGGIMAYTKNVAMRVASFGATCNSLDPGGVLTALNNCVINDKRLWQQIMDITPLKRWATPQEIADWAYFLTVVNKFCTSQNILVDGGESSNYKFIWGSKEIYDKI